MSNITAVVFDFGNVLAKIDRLKICRNLSKHSPLSPEEICRRIFGTDIEFDSETGKYDSIEHFKRIKERIEAYESWRYDEFYEEYKNGFEENPDGEAALEYAGRKARVFVLSNTSEIHARWLLENRKLSSIPELFIFSFEVGVMKPDPGIWEALCKLGSVRPEECLYIDDVVSYCSAAEKLGFNTIHYDYRTMVLKDELSRWF